MLWKRGHKCESGFLSWVLGACILAGLFACGWPLKTIAFADDAIVAQRIGIVLERGADDVETRVADVLKRRIQRRCGASVETGKGDVGEVDLHVFLGCAGRGGALDELCVKHGVTLPGREKPAPEGFAVKTVRDAAPRSSFGDVPQPVPAVLAVGSDNRGVLYAGGELLRRLRFCSKGVALGEVDVATAPAYRFRGFSASQGGTMMSITKARAWTVEEWQEYVLDMALAGANCFYAGGAGLDFVKSFDLLSVTGCRPNELSDFPKEWQASERGHWVCPSIPEARQALLERWDREFQNRCDYDIMRMFAGDPGGCRCERCMPWGRTFIHLCEEVAQLWLKYHPNSIVMIANQDVTNAGDQAIFDYLNETPRDWLYGIAYGPGSNAMSPYFRSELREDLFVYPCAGPVNRYLAETLNQIPKYQKIVHYSDITHWISAQYQVENPEPHLLRVYGRRTFHTRPKAYYRVFQAIMPFSEGDIIYSEGYHDEFHQYLWNRLLWDSSRSLDDVTSEYCRLHFGETAADLMQEAMYQLEETLEAPLAANSGVARYYLLVKEAGWKIPPHIMKGNHRWRLHMQKAALDKYLQLKLRIELAQEARIVDGLRASLESGELDSGIGQAAAIAKEPLETPGMKALKDEAGRLGEESDALYGVRNVGYFSLDQPLTGLPWISRVLEQAAASDSLEEKRELLTLVAGYTTLGEGEFYDDAGNKDRQPHLARGDSFDATAMMDPTNRPSQNTLAYDLEEARGVVFRYTGLDPDAAYKVRMTLVMPRIPLDLLDLPAPPRKAEHILVDGEYLAKDVDIPEYTAEQFDYDIPERLTEDGSLELAFERVEGGIGTVVSEVWLIKK